MLVDLSQERFDFLVRLSANHRIFLLSNTNEIHMTWFKNYVDQLFGENAFFGLFEEAYLSHEIGMRKPQKETFQFVIDQNKLHPSKTLFIDDSPQHLVGAEKVGLQTIWLEPGMETIQVLDSYIG